jgi:hypothetical protein
MAEFQASERLRRDFARAFARVLMNHYGRPATVNDPQVRKGGSKDARGDDAPGR